jgi:hypothetical protein
VFFKNVFNLTATETSGTLISGGDFNMILISQLDSTNQNRKMSSVAKKINRILQDLGLFDIWRDFHRSYRGCTFYSARHTEYSRLDYFFMYSADGHRLKDCKVRQNDLLDHNGVDLTLHLDSKPRNTLWRLNTRMLNDPAFKESIKTELNVYLENNDNGEVSPATLWDTLSWLIEGRS